MVAIFFTVFMHMHWLFVANDKNLHDTDKDSIEGPRRKDVLTIFFRIVAGPFPASVLMSFSHLRSVLAFFHFEFLKERMFSFFSQNKNF
jgi:hypothetical protein